MLWQRRGNRSGSQQIETSFSKVLWHSNKISIESRRKLNSKVVNYQFCNDRTGRIAHFTVNINFHRLKKLQYVSFRERFRDSIKSWKNYCSLLKKRLSAFSHSRELSLFQSNLLSISDLDVDQIEFCMPANLLQPWKVNVHRSMCLPLT